MRKLTSLFWLLLCLITVTAQSWQQYATPEEAGWSSEAIEQAWEYADEIGSAAFMLIHDGVIVAMHGDPTRRFMCHSVRKSLLSALYGIHVDNSAVDIDKSLGELGIDDVHQLTDTEKTAKISDLLKARSGVFHPAAYETESMKRARPARRSHPPNTFWYYNNWDFNTLCTILMQHTNADFFEDFKMRLADPLGMEDFRLDDTYYHLEAEHSQYPAYPFRMSARDLARIGQLFAQDGVWHGKQLISEDWIRESTTSYSDNARQPGMGYGYMWWTGMYGSEHPNYSAQGVGNQAIIVFPEDNVVMVNRANTYQGQHVKTDDLRALTDMLWQARSGKPNPSPKLVEARFQPWQPPHQKLDLPAAQLSAYVGSFKLGEVPITVRKMDGGLQIDIPFAGKYKLMPTRDDTFMAEDAWYLIQFRRDADGDLEKTIYMKR